KIYGNVDKIKIELNILNSLIGSQNIEEEFRNIIFKYPETLECIPVLLAVRSNEIFVKDEFDEYLFKFNKMVYSIDDYVKFMKETGLFDLLENHLINNLYDYVLGVEVGLDSNGRKNRGGHDKMGDVLPVEISIYDDRSFDFVIKTDNQVYVIETNFYASGGSKLNETARSYKMLAEESKKVGGVTFIWFTDGKGWNSARKNLEETFNELDTLYSINDLENGVLNNLE
ncbi:MAG: restriction endonuclease, partial [Candidatus Melainabacteria bacterium LEY3_CP_29_8]